MTVSELLNWIIRAHDFQEDSGYDEIKDQYKLCLKQSLEKCCPTEDQLGYDADPGEMELAIAIAYTLNYGEIMDMESNCYDRTPPKIERFNARYLSESEFPPPPSPYAPTPRIRPFTSWHFPSPRNAYVPRPVDPAPCPSTPPSMPNVVEQATRIQAELNTLETRARSLEQEVLDLTRTQSETAVQEEQDRISEQDIDNIIRELEAEVTEIHEQAHSSNNGNQCSG